MSWPEGREWKVCGAIIILLETINVQEMDLDFKATSSLMWCLFAVQRVYCLKTKGAAGLF